MDGASMLGLALAAALLLPAPARAGSSLNPDDQIYLTYQGHLERQAWLGHAGGTGKPFGWLDVKLSWDAVAHFPNQNSFGKGVDIDYKVITGTISLDDSGDPGPQLSGLKSCSATLSPRFTTYRATATTQYDLVTHRYEMNLYQPPLTAFLLQSTDSSGDYCTVDPAMSSAVGLTANEWPQPTGGSALTTYANAWNEYDKFAGGHGPFVSTFTDTYTSPEGELQTITSTITASDAPLKNSGGPFLSKSQVKKIKAFYAGDIKNAIDAAKPYCLNYLTSLGTFGTGVLLLGSGTVGPVLAVAGSITSIISAPFCTATLIRIRNEEQIAHDPPDPNVTRIARPGTIAGVKLPSCSRYAGSARTGCKLLSADAQRVVTDARTVASLAGAASTTMNRYTSATQAANWAASTTQGKHLLGLTSQYKRALSKLTAAGKTYAHDLLARHLSWRFSAADAQRAIAGVLSLLAKQGVTQSALAPYAGTSLIPRSFDVLHQLQAL